MLLALKDVAAWDNPWYAKWIDRLTGSLGTVHGELILSNGERLTSLWDCGLCLDYRTEGYVPGWWWFVDVGGEKWEPAIRNWFDGEKGCKYDAIGLLRFVASNLGLPILPPVSGTRYWCTESVQSALNICGKYYVQRWMASPNSFVKNLRPAMTRSMPNSFAEVVKPVDTAYRNRYFDKQ